MELRLSEHFMLKEFEKSATATANGIDNTVPPQFIPRLEQLCKEILEPLREFAQQPIIIGSGYRCPVLNLKVGGVYASQHTMGEAADIHIPLNDYTDWDDNKHHTNMELAKTWFEWIINHTNFDQAIMESENGRDYWIHVSCKGNRTKNRHQVIRDLRKKS